MHLPFFCDWILDIQGLKSVFYRFFPCVTMVACHTLCYRVLPMPLCELGCTWKHLQNLYPSIKTRLHLNYSIIWTGQEYPIK